MRFGCSVLFLLGACAAEQSAAPASAPYRVVAFAPTCDDAMPRPGDVVRDVMLRYAKATRLARSDDEQARADAVRLLTELAGERPWFVHVHRALGIANGFAGAWLSSYVAYKRYLQLDVHAADRADVRAQLYVLETKQSVLKRYAEAEEAATRLEWASALQLLEEVLARKPSFPLAHRLLAIVYASTARAEEAIDEYETYLKLDALAVDRDAVETIIHDTRAALARQRETR
ncbi:MAG: hypothetical protein IT381_10240 [Deltaproteobacteria bacterium]|nr:hypothetical protein [Deltaproteobacteria bacterium]